jgi:hypothetical protein
MKIIGGVELEGTMFYWICWMYWIILTFIFDKHNPFRFKLSITVLVMIILANIHFIVMGLDLYAGGLFLLVLVYVLIGREKRGAIIYFFICSFIVTIAYVTFHLFEIFDPIWIVFKKEWMMAICFTIIALLLQKNLRGRLLIIVSGTMQGELLYAYILSKYQFPYSIGSLAYLDVCLLISAILAGWSCLENAGSFFGNHFNLLGKAKQKSS